MIERKTKAKKASIVLTDDTISRIETIVLRAPLNRKAVHNPVLAEKKDREALIIRVEAHSGLSGEGYVTLLGAEARAVVAVIESLLVPVLLGRQAQDMEACWAAMLHQTHLAFWNRAVVMRAIAAIDVALWDMRGKEAGMSLSHLWGRQRDRLPVVTMGTGWSADASDEEVVDKIQQLRADGAAGVKLKVGRLSPLGIDGDACRLHAVRRAMGDEFIIVADANQGWSLEQARTFAHAVSNVDLAWLEEPCLWLDDHHDLAALRSDGLVRVGAGQSEITPYGCRRMLSEKSVDVCNFDASLGGGPTAWRRVAQMARSAGVAMVHHQEPQLGLQMVAAEPNGLHLEVYEPAADPFFYVLVANPPRIDNGWCEVPQEPGWGISFDEDFIRRYRVT